MTTGTVDTPVYKFGVPLQELPRYQAKPPIGDEPTEVHEGLNVELLDEIMSFIKAHPQTWLQQSWYGYVDRDTNEERFFYDIETIEELNQCGTSFCFAGHVALREGFPAPPVPVSTDGSEADDEEWMRTVKSNDEWPDYESVESFAQKRLGISSGQAYALFAGDNTMEDLEKMVASLKNNPSATEHELLRMAERFN